MEGKTKIEDYSKYYIQGSDHYLIPKDNFKELFNEMVNWKENAQKYKEVIDKSYIRVMHLLDYYDHYKVLPKSIIEELINLQIDLDILKEVE